MSIERLILLLAALMGLTGVILAAVGSHLVPGLDQVEYYRSWQAASSMHLLHAVLLVFLASRYQQTGDRLIAVSALLIMLGVVLFSGSIYLSLTTALAGITRLAPAGGMLLMLGWLLIAVQALRKPAQ